MKEIDQSRVLSHVVDGTVDKLSGWFPKKDVQLWNGKVKNGIYLWVSGMKNSGENNRMEVLRIRKEDKQGEYEVQVPSPRMVSLCISVIPALSKPSDSLDCTALLLRSLMDDPFVDVGTCNWYGNEGGRAMLEEIDGTGLAPVPEGLEAYAPYRLDMKVTVGINSVREERFTRVQKRQFTAVKK